VIPWVATTCQQWKPHVLTTSAAHVAHVVMTAVVVQVAMTVLQHAVRVVQQAAMLLLLTVATSLLKPQVPWHRNLPFSASVK
jgi:hypothetical protein